MSFAACSNDSFANLNIPCIISMNSLADLLWTVLQCSPLMLGCCPKLSMKGEYPLVVVFWLCANSTNANHSTQSFWGWLVYRHKYCSTVALYLSVCPSVWGWYAVEGFPSILNSVYSAYMNNETNWGPLSEITFWGVPWSLKMWLRNMVATPWAVISMEIGNNQIILENRLTTVRMALFPCNSGNGPMMSTDMISQGFCGISFGCKGIFDALLINLFFWHLSHPATYFSTSFCNVGQ